MEKTLLTQAVLTMGRCFNGIEGDGFCIWLVWVQFSVLPAFIFHMFGSLVFLVTVLSGWLFLGNKHKFK